MKLAKAVIVACLVSGCGGGVSGDGTGGSGGTGGSLPLGIDVSVTSLTAPASASVGDEISIEYVVAYNGTPAFMVFAAQGRLSHQSDNVLNGTQVSLDVVSLSAGESETATASVTIPDNLANGTYRLSVTAMVAEGGDDNPANDTFEVPIEISGGGSCLADAFEDDDEAASAAVIDAGTVQERNNCFDATDWVAVAAEAGRSYGVRLHSQARGLAVPALFAFASDLESPIAEDTFSSSGEAQRVTFTAGATQTHYVLVVQFFGLSATGEGTEYTLEIGEVLPDLVASMRPPATLVIGDSTAFDYEVKNDGFGGADRSRAGVYLSPDAGVTTDDLLLSEMVINGLAVEDIAYPPFDEPVVIPTTLTPGDYYLAVIADADDQVVEFLETNNQSTPTMVSVELP